MVDISPVQDKGVLKEILKEGVGYETPGAGNKVTVHYTGTLLDGTKFDSSKDRNEPFKFDLGEGRVIKAWDIGVATMRKGEVAMLTCAPAYAYGKAGSPPKIPPDATLKFEIEMIDWSGEDLSPDKDNSIERFQLVKGTEFSTPSEGPLVQVHLTGIYGGKVFEDREVQFALGEGEDHGVIEGVEKALESFKLGEKSKLNIKSKWAFKRAGKPEFNIPPNADVQYIVELRNLEKGVESWNLDAPQKIEQAKLFKDKGTSYFKANKYGLAIKMYKKIISYLDYDYDYKDELKIERSNLLLSAHLNLALCYLKTEDYTEAKNSSNAALQIDQNNEKALFRRGLAHVALVAPEIAIKDFEKVLEIEPKNTAASKQIAICTDLIKKQLAREKKLYANMFDKFAKKDREMRKASQ